MLLLRWELLLLLLRGELLLLLWRELLLGRELLLLLGRECLLLGREGLLLLGVLLRDHRNGHRLLVLRRIPAKAGSCKVLLHRLHRNRWLLLKRHVRLGVWVILLIEPAGLRVRQRRGKALLLRKVWINHDLRHRPGDLWKLLLCLLRRKHGRLLRFYAFKKVNQVATDSWRFFKSRGSGCWAGLCS